MDSACKDLCFQKINELLQDEEKIVTCTSLATDLELSIRDAKTLLTEFVQDSHQVKRENTHVTFILSGRLKDSKDLAVYLVREEDLTDKKMEFDTLYTELIYSIQKSKIIDLNSIMLVDKNKMELPNNLLGSIISKNCIRRTVKKDKIPEPMKTEQHKDNKSFFKKISSNNVSNSKTSIQQSLQDIPSSQEKQIKAKQSNGIANYFAKASGNSKTNGSMQRESTTEKLKCDVSLKTENIDLDTTQKNNGEDKIHDEKEISETEKMEVENDNSHSKISKTKTASKKRKKSGKSDNGVNKKRKRIQEICDSDSSDIFEDEKDEDIIEKSDEEPEPIKTVTPDVPARKRIRKTVDEVHMDEEGFLVTTTKYIYESASEDEEQTVKDNTETKPKVLPEKNNASIELDNSNKKQQSKGSKNKKDATGKQTTIMNFFKKN